MVTYEEFKEYMNKMIVEINSTVLDEMDILSDHVYVYNDKEHKLVQGNFGQDVKVQ